MAWARSRQAIMILAGALPHRPEDRPRQSTSWRRIGFVVVSEDSICHLADPAPVHVLNSGRITRGSIGGAVPCENPDVQLVQLVSFGCGWTHYTDEVRRILEEGGKAVHAIKSTKLQPWVR